jgi:hypothetical protein
LPKYYWSKQNWSGSNNFSYTYVFGNYQYLHGIGDSQSGQDDNCNLVCEVMQSGV